MHMKNRHGLLPYLLMLPAVIMLLTFVVYPMVQNVVLSFKNYSLLRVGSQGVGFANYKKVLTDNRVWEAVLRTFIWTFINVAGALLIGLGAALLLTTKFMGSNVIKAIILIPWVLPSVITGYIWTLMFQEDAGIITYILKVLHLVPKGFSWFSTGKLAMSAAIMANMWRAFPFFTLMIYAKLNAVPSDYIEAAELEGVNPIQMFRFILFPFIKGTVYTCTYLCFIWSFNAYDILKVMTNGGPAEQTTTLSIMVQREAFQYYEISRASTMSVIMFLLMMSILLIGKALTSVARGGKSVKRK